MKVELQCLIDCVEVNSNHAELICGVVAKILMV